MIITWPAHLLMNYWSNDHILWPTNSLPTITGCYGNSSLSPPTHPGPRERGDSIHQTSMLTKSSDWTFVPLRLSAQIEEGFSRQPLGNNVKVEDLVLDFETGYMYNKTTGQTSLIRSSLIPKEACIEARPISHKAYKPFVRSYDAAGILPYSFHPATGGGHIPGRPYYLWLQELV